MAATKPTIDELRTQMEAQAEAFKAAQQAFAQAQAEETKKAQAAAFTAITEHVEAVSAAVGSKDAAAVVSAVTELSTFVKAQFGSPRRASSTGSGNGNGGTRSGGLRDLVEAYLRDNPGEHTPAGIAKMLDRSSGAVANACDTLVKTGRAEMTSDKPKRYVYVTAPETESA